jgi:hypothetical protein
MAEPRSKLYWDRLAHAVHSASLLLLPPARAEARRASVRQQVFATIERERRWGQSHASGGGSTLEYTTTTQAIVRQVVSQFGIQSMLDAPCGDFAWMPAALQSLPEGFLYTGADIVPSLIERNASAYPHHTFRVLDIVSDDLPACDLVFCRDTLQHLSVPDIHKALQNFSRSGSRYLLTTTHLRRSGWRNARECRTGQCRDRNLLLPPFDLPDPIVIFSEQDTGHKFLGLWRLPF